MVVQFIPSFFQAAHCVFRRYRTVIYGGNVDMACEYVWRSPEEYNIIHEEFDSETLNHDIALVKSIGPAPLSSRI
jgi:hypothetical protein